MTEPTPEDLWQEWFKDSVIVGSDPYFIKKEEFIPELTKLISKREIEAKIELLRHIDDSDTRFNHGTIELLSVFKQDLNRQKQLTELQEGKE